jgi:hypothetical protein
MYKYDWVSCWALPVNPNLQTNVARLKSPTRTDGTLRDNLQLNSEGSSKAAIQKIVDRIQERFRPGASFNDPLINQPDCFSWQVR